MKSRTLEDAWEKVSTVLWDVVIAGSGYGGSMAAAGLAGCRRPDGRPLKVLLLERGRAWQPGEFPSCFAELPGHVRIGNQDTGAIGGNTLGLIDLRPGADVGVMLANGLGGGSLINAGVLLEPRGLDADSPFNPILAELQLGGFYARARRMLGGEVQVDDTPVLNTIGLHAEIGHDHPLAKTAALRGLAGRGDSAGSPAFREVPLSVAMSDRLSSAGVRLKRCTLCGDCMTGCNVGAKESLDANLLAHLGPEIDAGTVQVVTGATLVRVGHFDEIGPMPGPQYPRGHWAVTVESTDVRARARSARKMQLSARRVVLAAGSLGSTEILLRSRSDLLQPSHRLGQAFSCNGDNLSAARGLPATSESCADEDLPLLARRVGPTITGSIEMPGMEGDDPIRPFLLQEFAVPGALRRLFDELVTTTEALQELAKPDLQAHGGEVADPLAVDEDAMNRTLLLGTIGHDAAEGVLELPAPALRGGRIDEAAQPRGVRVVWPAARTSPQLDGAHKLATDQVELQSGTTLLPNPLWRLLPKRLESLVSQPRGPVLTVHPLGGCAIGRDASLGVVDKFGRVHNAAPLPTAWEGGLLVMDGSIIPCSLGANPALTIAALALSAVEQWRVDWGLTDGSLPGETGHAPVEKARPVAPLRTPQPVRGGRFDTRIEIIERLVGPVQVPGRDGRPRDCILELTMAFEPAEVRSLASTMQRRLVVNAANPQSRARLYDRSVWQDRDLRLLGDTQRRALALADSPLRGELKLMHRDPSLAWRRRLRVVGPWARNRGLRDSYQALKAYFTGRFVEGESNFCERVTSLWDYASRAGECRVFDYNLTASLFEPGDPDQTHGWLPPSGSVEICGRKRLTYECRANPWQQLTRMRLEKWNGHTLPRESVLELDTRFLVGQGLPLLRIVEQRDQASALADLFSLGLHLARIILNVHLWTFRKPDQRPDVLLEPARLPGAIFAESRKRLEPRVTELVTDRWGEEGIPVRVLLSHYPQPSGAPSKLPPLVMIHGYSVSGSTFAHPSLKPNAAEYFWEQGRDVWVVDLRTSAGLDTATRPWAFEDVGLVDIPAVLLHIAQVSGRRVDVFAHCIGCAMLSMALLSDAADVRSGRLELGVDTWLTSEQLGTLAMFNGNRKGGPHPVVRSVVLSQKGPLLIYTDGNVFRAYLMQVLRRWLPLQNFQFRSPRPAGLATQVIDRLLASLPYPEADYDVENPRWPCRRTEWTSTRHRMDLLYGRDFNAQNLRPETLDAIDDLFGPMNLDTLSQVIHFTRFDTLTSQRGRGEFVTLGKLNTHWKGIPTLLLHGAENGLVDEATQRLLAINLNAAGVDVVAPPPLAGVGHQDLLIGRDSRAAFKLVEDFLGGLDQGKPSSSTSTPELGAASPPVQAVGNPSPPDLDFSLELPWVGPRLDAGLLVGQGNQVSVSTMSRPDRGESILVAFPVEATRGAAGNVTGYRLVAQSGSLGVAGGFVPSGRWSTATLRVPSEVGEMNGWMVVNVHLRSESLLPLQPMPGAPYRMQRVKAPAIVPSILGIFFNAFGNWLPEQLVENLTVAFVALDDVRRAYGLMERAGLRLAVGSCQYPSGLLDATCARKGTDGIAAHSDKTGEIDLVMFVGDQIYADATAGVLDPTRRDEKYDQPTEAALRQPGMRAVLRRLPSLMLLDDHELVDNWEPLPDPGKVNQPIRPAPLPPWRANLPNVQQAWYAQPFSATADGMQTALRDGGDAYLRFQWMQASRRGVMGRLPRDYSKVCAGVPIYLADTRTGRDMRGPHGARSPHILSVRQRRALQQWLLAHRDEPKIVASPSRLLPLLSVERRSKSLSDAWDGYPLSIVWLLRFLWRHRIRQTVFVSGDEHHSFVAEAWLSPARAEGEVDSQAEKDTVKIVCVHSSGLYAPFVFANGDRSDLAAGPAQDFSFARLAVRCCTSWAPGDGWARIVMEPGAASTMSVEFHKASTGSIALSRSISLR